MKQKNKTKLIYCMCFIFLMTGTFAGCDSKKPEETGKPLPTATPIPTKEPTPTLVPTATPEPTPTIEIPNQVLELYRLIYKTAKENNIKLVPEEEVGILDQRYSFALIGEDPYNFEHDEFFYNKYSATIYLDADKNLNSEYSYIARFNMEIIDKAILRDVIKVSLLIADPTLKHDELNKIMKDLLDSYEEGKRSKNITCGKYNLLIESSDLGYSLLSVRHENKINFPVDVERYPFYDYDYMMSFFSVGLKAAIQGEIIEVTDHYASPSVIKVKDNLGKEYLVFYSNNEFLFSFQEGMNGTWYGEIVSSEGYETPFLVLDYYELEEAE